MVSAQPSKQSQKSHYFLLQECRQHFLPQTISFPPVRTSKFRGNPESYDSPLHLSIGIMGNSAFPSGINLQLKNNFPWINTHYWPLLLCNAKTSSYEQITTIIERHNIKYTAIARCYIHKASSTKLCRMTVKCESNLENSSNFLSTPCLSI